MSDQHHVRGAFGAATTPEAAPPTPAAPPVPAEAVSEGFSGVPTQHRASAHPRTAHPLWQRQHWARRGDLLDGVARWGVMPTRHGDFRLQPVRLPRDLPLLVDWMNDPVVSAFWELCGPPELTEHHVRAQLDGDGRSVPCLGLLDERPMSYWEIYRADLDPVARHYAARPHDTGLHLLIGPATQRGRGVGSSLLAAVARRILRERQAARRVVAEPDVRNLPSVRAFLRAGFRLEAELQLPEKQAALMVYDRPLAYDRSR